MCKNLKPNSGFEKYLNILPVKKNLIKFRISNHDLYIETNGKVSLYMKYYVYFVTRRFRDKAKNVQMLINNVQRQTKPNSNTLTD